MTINNNITTISKQDIGRFLNSYGICGTSEYLITDMAIGLADITLALSELMQPNHPRQFTSTSLGETVTGTRSIDKFIKDRAELILRAGKALKNSSEEEERQAASVFIDFAKKINPAIDSSLPQQTNNIEDNIQVFQADSGEIRLKFSSKKARDTFLRSYGQAHRIPVQFCKGKQYENNRQGKTPTTYSHHQKSVYFPSYRAGRGELAINFGSKQGRNQFLSVLGAKQPDEREGRDKNHVEGKYHDIDGNHIFSAYGGDQQSTLYFGHEGSSVTPFDNGHYLRFEKLLNNNTYYIKSCERPHMVINRAQRRMQSESNMAINGAQHSMESRPTIDQLKQSYYRHASRFFNSGREIFKQGLSRDEILQALQARASRSDSGASASTLQDHQIPFN